MKTTLLVAAAIALGGCASQSPMHHHGASHGSAARYDQQMTMMRDMHQKMRAAKTPEERQALMAEHMKAMQGGMSMMCEMGGHGRGMRGDGPPDMAKRCMEMRDMTTEMMRDREAPRGPAR
ncbi:MULTISPECIES: hypothetical protein [unclassified Variovorax]|uniref:hypothetical protein n=1 Tax=unclassified Variovorax TaxID=663243 RepID=UPI00076C0000|nr:MULTISPECIES: hypothetical protein [unclassified Variovorax]KWT96821.1 hypothetical protein APY03_2254 [Variovorax sp. WDL1]PNG47196.1 hypothetical protein CHC06_07544 [Variovorax sp. B2]PNG48153.1 hypothetical protein CHC07_07324 [Variovorax sp. B4]VTV15076.1 hypothetical protein WDL1CHR_05519 [Variovorax sp. WDL1]